VAETEDPALTVTFAAAVTPSAAPAAIKQVCFEAHDGLVVKL
jgi:hypothetical protein